MFSLKEIFKYTTKFMTSIPIIKDKKWLIALKSFQKNHWKQ
jgi:hypothetical protein